MIDDTGSVEGMHAFIYCTKWRSGQVSPMPYGQTLKDRATQLLIKFKSGALVTQLWLQNTATQLAISISKIPIRALVLVSKDLVSKGPSIRKKIGNFM